MTDIAASQAPVVEATLAQLHALPFISHRWPDDDLNRQLREIILARAARERGIRASNIGGWHSRRNLQTWPDPAAGALVGRVRLLIQELVHRTVERPTEDHLSNWVIDAWANVNCAGSSNKSHNHTRGLVLWSGIYYVDPGDRSAGGQTVFEDRSGVAVDLSAGPGAFVRELWLEPQPGLMVLFPGSLYHRVARYQGEQPRITIAFNLKNPAFGLPKYKVALTPSDFMWEYFKGVMVCAAYVHRKLRRIGIG